MPGCVGASYDLNIFFMRRSVFIPTAALAIVCVAAKTVLVWKKLKNHPLLFFTISAEDILAILIAGIFAAVLLRATSRRKKLHRTTAAGLVVLGTIAAIFAVANIAIVHTLGYPLNARMLALAGRFTDLRSSMLEQASIGLVAGMIAAPLLFLIASHRRFRFVPSRKIIVGLLVVAGTWVAFGLVLRARAEPSLPARIRRSAGPIPQASPRRRLMAAAPPPVPVAPLPVGTFSR